MNEPIKPKYSIPTDYLESLENFGEHVKASKDELVDILVNDGEYETRFNLKLELNGKAVEIEFHADCFERLMTMIEQEITEYIEIHEVKQNGNS